jgi:hypothetical protein
MSVDNVVRRPRASTPWPGRCSLAVPASVDRESPARVLMLGRAQCIVPGKSIGCPVS